MFYFNSSFFTINANGKYTKNKVAIESNEIGIDFQSNWVTINPYNIGGIVHGTKIVGTFINPIFMAITGQIHADEGLNTNEIKYL